MRRFSFSLLGVIAVAVILFGINMIADPFLANARLDLTQGHIYTLSPGTKQLLSQLKDPITLRLFYSRDIGARIPSYGAYADRVRQMLQEYARLSHGKIRLEFYNPEPFSDVEDRALAAGLQGVPIDQAGEQVYFGLVGTNLLDDTRIIPFFQAEREPFLEYDLSRVVYELSNPKRPVVGLMTSLPLQGDPRMMMMRGEGGRPWISTILLRQSFTVRTVPLDTWMIDPDIQVLLVVQPQHLPDHTLYAIDQFVMRGGRLMVMVDPYNTTQASLPGPNGMPQLDVSSDLHKLFDAWGIVYDPNQVVGDLNGAWEVRSNSTDRVSVVEYVPWFNIRGGINRSDPATGDLAQVTVADPGFIEKNPKSDIVFTPLLQSSPQSGLISVEKLRISPDPAQILAGFKIDGHSRVIAARIHGVLKSAFSGPPQVATATGKEDPASKPPANLPPYRSHTEGAANLVVVADADILADRFWVHVDNFFGQEQATPFSGNGAFVANLIGSLAGGDILLGLRGRGVTTHPFTLVDEMQRKAELKFRQTEQALQTHLEEIEKKLSQLRQGSSGSGAGTAVLTPEQQAAIDAAEKDILQTRRQLRDVEFRLKHDIDALDFKLRLLDIVAVPAALTVLAIILGVLRSRRRAYAHAGPGQNLPKSETR